MISFLFAFLMSYIVSWFLIKYQSLHIKFSNDSSLTQPQKFHTHEVSRVGGIAIYFGMLMSALFQYNFDNDLLPNLFTILLFSAFIFFAGLYEDLTSQVKPILRFFLILFFSYLLIFYSGIRIIRLDINWLDLHFQNYYWLSIFLSVIAIAAITNAFNIIDGFNGLASGISLITLLCSLIVSVCLNDSVLTAFTLIGIGAIFGFFVWNWPSGKIFMGDSGAYLIGFFVSLNLICLVQRNPEVSPWLAIVLLNYPIIEVLFSIYRKSIVRRGSPSQPDGIHFHMLIFKRISRKVIKKQLNKANSLTSLLISIYFLLTVIPSLFLFRNTKYLMVLFLFDIFFYLYLYKSLINFRIKKIFR